MAKSPKIKEFDPVAEAQRMFGAGAEEHGSGAFAPTAMQGAHAEAPGEPPLARVEMGDEPLPVPEEFKAPAFPQAPPGERYGDDRPQNSTEMKQYMQHTNTRVMEGRAPAADPHLEATLTAGPGEEIKYSARISIVEAYRFDGRLHAAPPWVDRNWAAYDTQHQPPGPILRVPSQDEHYDGKDVGVVHVGDYLCKQDVTLDDGEVLPSQLAVMTADEFKKLYRPYLAKLEE